MQPASQSVRFRRRPSRGSACPFSAELCEPRPGASRLTYCPSMRVAHNKLVRDRIPQIIAADGHRAVTRVLDEDSYRVALLAKLVEEAQEASSATADDLPGELADIVEVLQAIVTASGMAWDQLLALTADKRARRGCFDERLFLEYVEEGEPEQRP